TCESYKDASLKGQGDSTASQTAWALIGLMAAVEAMSSTKGAKSTAEAMEAIARGMTYLLETQRPDGTWDESYFTGTGFPCHFYLKYHLYQQHFPLTALGRYQKMMAERSSRKEFSELR
ncbi:MAG: hypothetical protein SVX43_19920, partial [Cyanobacteriota bacterium]|nr:hypothetical protein [Cyanobacteriota bacterium]